MKFYESNDVGNIHLFESEDYFWVCKHLITPSELNEYLEFRERLFLKHKAIINVYPEQYILAHFLNTDDESIIKDEYIESLSQIELDSSEFDMTGVLDSFVDKILHKEHQESTQYYLILKEIVKLKRYELREFKIRFNKIINDAESNNFSIPNRITIPRTECGFVFISLMKDKSPLWENALINFTSTYKYKRQLEKCIGIIAFKNGMHFDLNWVYLEFAWEFDRILEVSIKGESKFYGEGGLKEFERYKLNN